MQIEFSRRRVSIQRQVGRATKADKVLLEETRTATYAPSKLVSRPEPATCMEDTSQGGLPKPIGCPGNEYDGDWSHPKKDRGWRVSHPSTNCYQPCGTKSSNEGIGSEPNSHMEGIGSGSYKVPSGPNVANP